MSRVRKEENRSSFHSRMTIWLDAHLSPRTAVWIASEFGFTAKPLREIGLRDAEDYEIFQAAKEAGAVLLTKDTDFVHLLERHGSPPKILWLTCGNTSELAATARKASSCGCRAFRIGRKPC